MLRIISGPSTCSPHASGFVCLLFIERTFRQLSVTAVSSHFSGRIDHFRRIQSELSGSVRRLILSSSQVQKRHSIPIASVRRKRQRLPSSLLIENASARI